MPAAGELTSQDVALLTCRLETRCVARRGGACRISLDEGLLCDEVGLRASALRRFQRFRQLGAAARRATQGIRMARELGTCGIELLDAALCSRERVVPERDSKCQAILLPERLRRP